GYTKARPSITAIIRRYKVSYVTSQLSTLGTAYALTEDVRYAHAAKAILLRLAEVLPKYLVRAGYGYGEFADCDPHVAAERISDLPTDEIVYPPNKPDRKLHAGYWAASRTGSSGQDGRWVARVTEAYDLTCTARDDEGPVFSRDEQIRIERDVLLEGTYLAVCDARINNKSVSNRAGAAMVGLCVGHPGLVRFGIEGFTHTVDDWFLPDGGTSESPAYALMTMSGVRPFGIALRDYSDPPGYTAPDGTRLDHFNACRDTRYGDCWQSLIWTLQGNLRYPPSADSYRTTGMSASRAELIAVAYATDEHIALLRELAGEDLSSGSPREAIFYREPGLEARKVEPLSLPDVVFPFLSQGYLRRGERGRDAALLLNASDWGGHHHYDSLDLYYWQDGRELLSDLGYLWDHPDKHFTRRTFAHNLVLIDGEEQRSRDRAGSFHIFAVTPSVKVMEASSQAYESATEYRRTCVLVDHGDVGAYVVDIFRAGGGNAREYVLHGPGNDYEVDGLQLALVPGVAGQLGHLAELDKAQRADGGKPWHVTWSVDDEYQFAAFAPGAPGETIVIGAGWGQRDHRNTDRGATLPYIIRRRTGGTGLDTFATVFAGGPKGSQLVRGVSLLPVPPGDAHADAIAIAVETP
ncbi:MAG: heparinase II/III family protein, partial [Armatimonadota bacterium]